eukprot:PhF_6_TR5528/c2_g1_i1/m.7851
MNTLNTDTLRIAVLAGSVGSLAYYIYRSRLSASSSEVNSTILNTVCYTAPMFTSSQDRQLFCGLPKVLATVNSQTAPGTLLSVVEYEPDPYSEPEECKWRILLYTTPHLLSPPEVYIRTVIRLRSTMSPRSAASKWLTINPTAELNTTRAQLAALSIAVSFGIRLDHILVLGLGDGCLVNLLEYSKCMGEWDHMQVTAVEADPAVSQLAETYCGLPKNLKWTDNIVITPYDKFLSHPDQQNQYDVVFLTNVALYGGLSKPLTTEALLAKVKGALSTANLSLVVAEVSYKTLAEARETLRVFRAAFPPTLHVIGITSSSMIIVGVNNPFPWITKDGTKNLYIRHPTQGPISVLRDLESLRGSAKNYLVDCHLDEMYETRKDQTLPGDPSSVVYSAYRIR